MKFTKEKASNKYCWLSHISRNTDDPKRTYVEKENLCPWGALYPARTSPSAF
jgi:hypothetical protein